MSPRASSVMVFVTRPIEKGYFATHTLTRFEEPPGVWERVIVEKLHLPAVLRDVMLAHLENETQLVAQARSGDTDAFETLVRQYDRKISRLTLKITRNPEDADDALQDAFLKAYANLGFFQGDSRFYTWLARIAVNEALTRLRRHSNHRMLSFEDDGAPRDVTDRCEDPEQQCARAERRQIVNDALDELEPPLRRVLSLRYLDDYSSEEIARRLNLTVPAVKSRLMRARLKLRHRLHRQFDRNTN